MARIRKNEQSNGCPAWKVALYIRLSKEDGNDESLSVGNQRKILQEYVQNHFEEEYAIADVYIDDGKTGTDVNRPNFMRMERDINEGKVNCIIVKSLARAFRNLGDQQKYLEEYFPLLGVRFINLGTPFIDTYANPRSILGLEVPIHGMFNEQFAASTSEEVRKTLNTKRREGEFIGAFAPYGYKKHPDDKNRLVVDEEAADVVRDIFSWYLHGIEGQEQNGSASICAITRELNERGIPCPSKYKQQQGLKYLNPQNHYGDCYWSFSGVSKLLRERVYIGCMVQGRSRIISYKVHKKVSTSQNEWFVVENTHEAIIKKEIFDEVQRRLGINTRTPYGKKEVYLFSGLLRCADCGRPMYRKGAKDHIYYYCRTKELRGRVCARRSIKLNKLEAAVLQALNVQISLVDNLSQIVNQINKSPQVKNQSSRLNATLKHHEAEYAKFTNITDSLYFDWKNGDITREEYLRMKSNYTDKANKTMLVIEKIKEDCYAFASGITSGDPYFLEFKKYGIIKTLRRDLLLDLIDTILVHENGELTIRFKFADQYKHILDFIETNDK